jgi:Fic family protein
MYFKPQYQITSEIISLLQEISNYQGRIDSWPRNMQQELYCYSLANVDAVHFSTKIEGNKLSLKQVTDILNNKNKSFKQSRDLREVINYAKARTLLLEKAIAAKAVNSEIILETHHILMNKIVEGRLKGHYRTAQNVIKDSKNNRIVYLPPEAREVVGLIKNMLSLINELQLNGTSQLIIAPYFHYYFVTIHPFIDGNGRLARLLTNYLLLLKNFTVTKYASIEKQHEETRNLYYASLHKFQGHNFYDIPKNIDITSWIEYWLICLKKTYQEALTRTSSQEQAEPNLLNLDLRLQKAYSLFRKHRRIKASDYTLLMGLGRTQAVADLNNLTKSGYIQRVGGGRSAYYQILI